MKFIPVGKQDFAMVDDEDFEELSKYQWSLQRGRKTKYAARSFKISTDCGEKPATIGMHRQILGLPAGTGWELQTDHLDGNGLNNQRRNLEVVTASENCRRRGRPRGRISKYRGVTYDKQERQKKNWQAIIMINKKSQHLGRFLTEVEAAVAYNMAAVKQFGSAAVLNIISHNFLKF